MSQVASHRVVDWLPASTLITAATTIIVGFVSTIPIVTDAARSLGATPGQTASWVAALCYGMAVTTFMLSVFYRMPVITAWSTPGAVLIATSAVASGYGYAEALGAFVFAGVLMVITAMVKPLARLIERIPTSIAAAMLAGVLVQYCLKVPGAIKANPLFLLPMALLFLLLRLWKPMLAVPITVVLGIVGAFLTGTSMDALPAFALTPLEWTTPEFHLQTLIGIGLPLYLVSMASQNLPGFAVMRLAGYPPPVSAALGVTGGASVLLAPFGSHAITMAAITAALCSGPDCHPDPKKRWLVAPPYLVLYCALGLVSGSFVALLAALPLPVFTTLAGLALLSPLMGAIQGMAKDAKDIDAAAVAFLVTAASVSFLGIGSAFWGLIAGLVLHVVKGAMKK
jgi:benzoate membrane transport protein